MGDLRVVYLVNPRQAVAVPELLVRFRCEKCGVDVVLDAFDGPPVCQIHRVVLEGISVMREPTLPERIVELDAGALELLQQSSSDKGGVSRAATKELDAMFNEETPT